MQHVSREYIRNTNVGNNEAYTHTHTHTLFYEFCFMNTECGKSEIYNKHKIREKKAKHTSSLKNNLQYSNLI